ncbi:MAG: cytochrome c3 family protein [Geothermobacteraceae bacterium]
MRFSAILFLLLVSICAGLGSAGAARYTAKTVLDGAHGDRQLLPKSCRACHRGMAMAIRGEEAVCFRCHGSQLNREQMIRSGALTQEARLENIEREFQKPYRHPVEKSRGVHHPQERLPEEQVNAARHVECVDCHHPHLVDNDQPYRGLYGRRVGNLRGAIENEYEVCYRCHAESANLPIGSTNKHAEFAPTNKSYHPVEAEGRNLYVISLLSPYNERQEKPGEISRLTCSDCHGSDDPTGPQGPHGSNYAGLLKKNYDTSDERPESRFAYELCYGCHDRTSILSNESFPYHALHIQGNSAKNLPGTSCHTCHDAHGSSQYQYLIRFNEDVVAPNADGKREFKATGVGSRHGSCLLNCHGVEHNPLTY